MNNELFERYSEKVSNFNPDLKLVRYFQKGTNKKLVLKCSDETHEEFEIYLSTLGSHTKCNKCRIKEDKNILKWDIGSVREWVKNNAPNYTVLRMFNKNKRNYIEVKCNNEKHPSYTITIGSFRAGKRCKLCSLERTGRKEWDSKRLKAYIEEKGYIISDDEIKNYKNTKTKFTIIDKLGYKYYTFIENLQLDRKPQKVYFLNPHTIDNINLYLKLNNRDLICLEDTFKSNSIKMNWKYIGDEKIEESKRYFKTTWNSISSGVTCPYLSMSKGERLVNKILTDLNIKFIPQKTFKKCKKINLLSFDFYLSDYNILIEYQGQLHEEKERLKGSVINCFGGIKGLLNQTKSDLIKQKFCRENNIRLVPIWHYEQHQIKNIIKNLILTEAI